jgi:hypothetical protein
MMAALSDFAALPRWCAWRNEERAGKLTKAPYSPVCGRMAKSNDPATWASRPMADEAAARIVNGHGGGTGIFLGDLGDGRALGGVDLDTCRSPDGSVAAWAMEVLERLGTYAEVSPSGTGIKAFFTYPTAALAELRAMMTTDWGKAWKRPGGSHPPAIELHLGNRYFAVTGERIDGAKDALAHIGTDALGWIIREAGPGFQAGDRAQALPFAAPAAALPAASGAPDLAARIDAACGLDPALARRWAGGTDGLADPSRSGLAFAIAGHLKRRGFDAAAAASALRINPHTAAWMAEKGDAQGGREFARAYAKAGQDAPAAAAGPDEKRPLHRALDEAAPYPMSALGALRPAAEAILAKTQAPAAICAQAVLAAATVAVMPHRNVILPTGHASPISCFFATVAASGERKTSADSLAKAPLAAIERRWFAAHRDAKKAWLTDHNAWKAATEQAKRGSKGDRGAIRAALERIGPEPEEPVSPMLLPSEPTPEALVELLKTRPFVGVFTTEGAQWIGGAAFTKDNESKSGGALNALWDGDQVNRLRVTTGAAFLFNRRAAINIMMQPAIAADFFGNAKLDSIGFLARFLSVAPASNIGTRLFKDAPPDADWALSEYADQIETLFARPIQTQDCDPASLDPAPLPMSAEARKAWIDFHDMTERAQGEGGRFQTITPFASKMPEHAARLSGVLTVFADPDAREISGATMAAGIILAEYYAGETLRMTGASAIMPELAEAARLLAWWQARPDPRVHLANIYQVGPRSLRSAADAKRAVAILEEHGWLRRLPGGTVLDGKARADAWTLA